MLVPGPRLVTICLSTTTRQSAYIFFSRRDPPSSSTNAGCAGRRVALQEALRLEAHGWSGADGCHELARSEMLLQDGMEFDVVGDAFRAGDTAGDGDEVPVRGRAASSELLDVLVSDDADASAAHHLVAVIFHGHDNHLRAGATEDVDDGHRLDLLAAVGDWDEDFLLLFLGGGGVRAGGGDHSGHATTRKDGTRRGRSAAESLGRFGGTGRARGAAVDARTSCGDAVRERDDRGGHENDATHSWASGGAFGSARASEGVDDPRISGIGHQLQSGGDWHAAGVPRWTNSGRAQRIVVTHPHASTRRRCTPCAPPSSFVRPSRASRERSKRRGAVAARPALRSEPRRVVAVASSGNNTPDAARRGDSATAKAFRNPLVFAASGMTVIPGDYRIGGVLLSVAAFLGPVCHLWTQFGVHGFLGAFLAFQASRVRFRFSDTDLDVVFIEPGADDSTARRGHRQQRRQQAAGRRRQQVVLRERHQLGVLVPRLPVLVYYKENQTRPEGQPHFFPIIMDGKKLYEQMLEKMPTSVNPKPDPSEWNLDTAFEATPVGRKIKESLSEDQLKQLKETKGFPGLDK